MIVSDLYTPLPARKIRTKRRVPARKLMGLGCVVLASAASFIISRDNGDRGDPMMVGSIVLAPPAAVTAPHVSALPAAPADSAMAATTVPAAGTAQQIQMENGVMVIRGGVPGAATPMTLKVADLIHARTAPPVPDAQLIESTATGPLPRIARDGRRPSSVYAAAPATVAGKPRIALLIGGMGLDRAATAQASAQLPPAVTFGFAPYGENLGEQVGFVRSAGHEVILQMPMEDFGRDTHGFPNMLKTGETGNGARLHWLMSRFTGYAGVANYLGGRLLADEGSLKPVLQDVAARGLYFVDDGTAPRSLALPVSHDLNLPAAKADVVIDAQTDPASVSAAMLRLEKLARERGSAFGVATGRAATNAMIGRYLEEAARRGVVVVPVSQVVAAPPAVAVSQ